MPAAVSKLADSTWDFAGADTKGATHVLHAYPAMMIPQVARRLIELGSEPGATVLDPFCGSGSVLVEGLLAGRRVIGIDLNPLAVLISKVKTTPIAPDVLEAAFQRIVERSKMPSNSPPQFKNRDFWFSSSAVTGLGRILSSIRELEQPEVRAFFEIAFSEAVRACSNSREREFKLFRYAPEILSARSISPETVFGQKCRRNISAMRRFHEQVQSLEPARIHEGDTRKFIPEIGAGSVDLVVTSPAYGDARTTVAYGQYSRLPSQWLGLGGDVDPDLLGGHRSTRKRRGTKSSSDPAMSRSPESPLLHDICGRIAERSEPRSLEVSHFFADFDEALSTIASYLKPRGKASFVVGNRTVTGVQVPMDEIVAELGPSHGLIPESITIRAIPSKTLPLKNSPSNRPGEIGSTMRNEYIVWLRKDG